MPILGIARWKRTQSPGGSMRSTRGSKRRTPGNPKCRSMISSTKASFRKRFEKLPPGIRQAAIESYRLWQRDPWEPSLHFKKVGDYWSVRVGDGFRALATRSGERVTWFWIGPHDEYLRMIRS